MSDSIRREEPRPLPVPLYLAIFLISAAALAYELLLMRLFSIVQWHHFAYMVISLALLGYGASGTFLTFCRDRLLPCFTTAYSLNAALFGIAAIACFQLAQRLPFNILELFWDPGQWLYLLLAYLLLFIPFFFAANCLCLAFARFGDRIARIYAFDLAGAGVGALGIVMLLYHLTPTGALRVVACLGLLAALLVPAIGKGQRYAWIRLVVATAILAVWLLPEPWIDLRISPYKPLSQSLEVMGSRVIRTLSSPLGELTVVENSRVPLRLAPGLSLNSSAEPPPQLGLFIDAGGPIAINRYRGRTGPLAYLDQLTSALPYHLISPERMAVLGLGGGSAVLQALYHRVPLIDAVELNPQLAGLLKQGVGDFAGWDWMAERVRIHEGEARGYFAANRARYGLIQLDLLDSVGAALGGMYALSEEYLYTREGIVSLLRALEPDGLLVITRWVKLPPRDSLKLFATAIDSLRLFSVVEPDRQLALIRGWSTSTLLVKNGRFTEAEIRQLKTFCRERSFDAAFFPGITPEEVNRYNILPEPYFYRGATALLGVEREPFLERYKFYIHPADDNRPYFFNFFKWSTLPEILSLYRQGGYSVLELGYPVLVLTLLQALPVSLLLILFPLRYLRSKMTGAETSNRLQVFAYFLAIGLAYLFIEIAFIQRFTLFLADPILTIAVVLCGFLVFSGLGSLYAATLERPHSRWMIVVPVLTLCGVALSYLLLLTPLFAALAWLSTAAKIALSLLLIAPLAFCMGIPFPYGLGRVAQESPELVPWAWGINGCASLLSAILATLLAVHLGFTWVVAAAVLLYLAAALLFIPAGGSPVPTSHPQ